MKILSWNICWGCMAADESSKDDLTAAKLAVVCQANKVAGKPTCLFNVVDFIQKSDYDLIALQESKNWEEIYENIKDREYLFANYSMRHPWGAIVDITVFYKKQFTIEGGYFGDIVHGDARPYQFLLMNDGTKRFYFINIHNGHLISKTRLEEIINSNNLYIPLVPNVDVKFIDDEWIVNGNHITPTQIPKENLPLIIAGDFNDHGKYNYWQDLTINTKKLSSVKPPPTTCCTPVKNKYVWLGAPSMLYDPLKRKEILGVDLDFIFDITTFSSTACVGANGRDNFDYDLCHTIGKLKERCFNDRYRSHNALSGPLERFLTTFDEVDAKIRDEQMAGVAQGYPYQRYNEIIAIYFPWEIFGIEVGGHDISVSKEFQAKVNENRRLLLEEYASIDINKIIRMINDPNRTSVYTDTTSGEYLLIKYFKILKCNNKFKEELVEPIIKRIIENLSYPIELYEYGRKSTSDTFSLFKVNDYRKTPFEVFTQAGSMYINGVLPVNQINKYDAFKSTNNMSSEDPNSASGSSTSSASEDSQDYLTHPLIVRCLLIDTQSKDSKYGTVQIDEFITEIFKGRIPRHFAPNGWLNLVINPATVILQGTNVILSSQIFDRDFLKNKLIRPPTTYNEYFDSLNIGLRTRDFNNDIKLGDYILASDDFSKVTTIIPELYKNYIDSTVNPTSDHIPVEAVVEFNTAGGKRKTRKRRKPRKTRKTRRRQRTRKYTVV